MTTRHENQNPEGLGTCPFCGGTREDKITTIPVVVDEKVVVVKGVQAEVCRTCGEAFLSTEMADTVADIVRDAINKNVELTVVNLSETVPILA